MRGLWHPALWRLAPSGAALAGLLILAALQRAGLAEAYRVTLSLWDVFAYPMPFLDLSNSLAAWDCTRLGFDVVQNNPCDILGRPYNYSPVWMAFHAIPLTQADLPALGLLLDVTFILSLAALPPAADRGELLLRILAATSSMVAFVAERANIDAGIFLLVLAAVLLLRGGTAWRMVGYGVVAAAAAIKYYPATLLALALRERPAVFAAVALIGAIGGGWLVDVYVQDMIRGARYIPAGSPFGDMFGARNMRLGLLLIMFKASGSVAIAWATALGGTAMVAVLTAVRGLRMWRRADWPRALAALPQAQRWPLLAAALLIVGCFFAGQNIAYRGIFLLLALPGLGALRRVGQPVVARLCACAAVTIVLLMWIEAVRWWITLLGLALGMPKPAVGALQALIWLGRELAWWGLIGHFGLLLAAFLTEAPLLHVLLRRRRAHA